MDTRSIVLFALVASTLAGCQPSAPPIVNVRGDNPEGQEGLTVTGKAVVRAEPDLAILSVGYGATAGTAQEARKSAQGVIQRVIASVREQGVKATEVQTRSFHLSQSYDSQRRLRQWQAHTMLEVRVRDVEQSGEVLDAAMAAGANQVQGVEYTIEALETLRAKARNEACRVAKNKADQFARALGAKLGRPVAIREFFGDEGFYRRNRNANAQVSLRMDDGPQAPRFDYDAVSPGAVGIELTVEVVYGLQQ